jgi:hypothetical protein
MKKLLCGIITFIMIISITTTVSAQNTAKATTNAGATIVSAISITSDIPLNFGVLSVPTADVNVILSTANARIADKPSNISLLPGTTTNAHYNINGAVGCAYTITLPATNAVSISNGSNSMKVENFLALTKSTSNGTGGTLTSTGIDDFVVGATLQVKSGQPTGTYSGTFDVLVAYN